MRLKKFNNENTYLKYLLKDKIKAKVSEDLADTAKEKFAKLAEEIE